nr:MAG TPA: hypothetical protein [Caudoviricetes sp.]
MGDFSCLFSCIIEISCLLLQRVNDSNVPNLRKKALENRKFNHKKNKTRKWDSTFI